MKLEFNQKQLLALMKDFYVLTGIRMVLFDDEYHALLSYPTTDCAFCRCMKNDSVGATLCAASDERSFQQSRTEKRLILYTCHAGLIEATIPLVDNHIVIGYLMFGQISDSHDLKILEENLTLRLKQYGLSTDFDITDGIPLKSDEQIQAAAKIMEACTFYALLNQTISLRRETFRNELRQYLLSHLQQPLNSYDIAKGLGVSRSKLYQQCQQYLGMGIGEYLRKLRIEKSQQLLKGSHLSITEIASTVGFADYNYFCRVFKAESGCSAKKYRSAVLSRKNTSDDTLV